MSPDADMVCIPNPFFFFFDNIPNPSFAQERTVKCILILQEAYLFCVIYLLKNNASIV